MHQFIVRERRMGWVEGGYCASVYSEREEDGMGGGWLLCISL